MCHLTNVTTIAYGEENMSHLLVPKSQKSLGKSGGQKSEAGQAPLKKYEIQ